MMWHCNLTLIALILTLNPDPNLNLNSNSNILTITLTLKVKIIYGVKDDTETKLQILLYLKVIFIGMGWVEASIHPTIS